jgi:hypothetical protein
MLPTVPNFGGAAVVGARHVVPSSRSPAGGLVNIHATDLSCMPVSCETNVAGSAPQVHGVALVSGLAVGHGMPCPYNCGTIENGRYVLNFRVNSGGFQKNPG